MCSTHANIKSLLTPHLLMGSFPSPLTHSGKRPIKVGKRPIKEGKRPINANGQFSATPPWWKTAPLKRHIERSMRILHFKGPARFRKGVGRQRGLAKGNPSRAIDSGLFFCPLFSYAPLAGGEHNSARLFKLYFGRC